MLNSISDKAIDLRMEEKRWSDNEVDLKLTFVLKNHFLGAKDLKLYREVYLKLLQGVRVNVRKRV